ncbi:MAG: type I 3-dehydroquinate dehydratase [Pyrinomonadaceae bacterium]
MCAKRQSFQPALEHAADWGDYVEIRLDYLTEDELKHAWRILPKLLAQSTRSVILTLRSLAQGGIREVAPAEMQTFVQFAEKALSEDDFVDIELDYLERHVDVKFDKRKIICSYHNFAELPPDLDAIFDRLAQTSAGVLKIAVRPQRITDCIPIFRLLERARRENRELIAIAMDEAGALTRVLVASRGAFLTFGALQ